MRIAFVVGSFPAVTETFIIDQVADLIDRGIDVEIFSFRKGDVADVSPRYHEYRLADRTRYLNFPDSKITRIFRALPLLVQLMFYPVVLGRMLNMKKYGADAGSLKLLFWSAPFVGRSFDLYHCHFGPMANRFLVIRDILGIKEKFITTFYGYDASLIFRRQAKPYERLKKEGSLFLAMSQNMKDRLVAQGFPTDQVLVQPVGINPGQYPFKERIGHDGSIEIISVGRLVAKKGFADLLDALAIVKQKSSKSFRCTIVGSGPLNDELRARREKLGLQNEVVFAGQQPVDKIVSLFGSMDFYVQASKTALDGDME
jgi:colanic acid/amylovoran biosynthesis glycosyltransferase